MAAILAGSDTFVIWSTLQEEGFRTVWSKEIVRRIHSCLGRRLIQRKRRSEEGRPSVCPVGCVRLTGSPLALQRVKLSSTVFKYGLDLRIHLASSSPSFPSFFSENGLPPSGRQRNAPWSVLCEMLRPIKSFLYLNSGRASGRAGPPQSSHFHDFLCPTICPASTSLPRPPSLARCPSLHLRSIA